MGRIDRHIRLLTPSPCTEVPGGGGGGGGGGGLQ